MGAARDRRSKRSFMRRGSRLFHTSKVSGYSGYWQKNLQPCWVYRTPEWDTHSDVVYNNLKRKIAYAQGIRP